MAMREHPQEKLQELQLNPNKIPSLHGNETGLDQKFSWSPV